MTTISNLQRVVGMRGTKSTVAAFSASLEEIALSYATDTGELGVYTNSGWVWFASGTFTPSASTSYPLIYDDGVLVGTGTALSFNNNLNVAHSGTYISVSAPVSTYQRVAQPVPLVSLTNIAWTVPDRVFASGSLAVFSDGNILTPGVDYTEQFYCSGTFLFTSVPSTGTVFVAMYGVPCIPQPFPSTGSARAIYDSNNVELHDTDNVLIFDSLG